MMSEAVISIRKADLFQEENMVLNQVNFEMNKGEFAYLIGKTGSGKSTLLKTLYGDLKLENGEGEVAGFDLKKIRHRHIHKLRRELGIVFQDFQLLTDRNALENLVFVLKATGWKNRDEMLERAREVLGRVGLQTKDYKMPHQLSGGEQQRLVIARALLNTPQIVLADEPTGNLDPEISNDITQLLHTISKEGTAVLMATHEHRLLERYPAKIFLVQNSKVEAL